MTLDTVTTGSFRPGICLIRPIQTQRESTIILPDIYDARQPIGRVLNAGRPAGARKLEVSEGDWVVFDRESAAEWEIDGEVLNVVRHEDIDAIVEA
jgi:co-chaperonin GroES (HSP10)